MTESPRSRAKTTETSLSIIQTLKDFDGATIEELADALDLAPSTIHRHLVTLREHRFVTKRGEQYQIGLQFLTFGGYAQRQVIGFPMIKEKVEELAQQTGEHAQFVVEEEGERVYLYTATGDRAVHTGANIGKRGEIHTSAAGKAILACLPEDGVDKIIERHGLGQSTERSITDRTTLLEELETVRTRGYAINLEETTKGVHAVGAAVTTPDGRPLGALSVSGPANRVREEELRGELVELVLGLVNELELHIEHAIL